MAVPLIVAASLTVVFASTTPATGQTGGASISTLPNAGVLRLRLGSEDHLRFQPPNGTGGYSPFTMQQNVSSTAGCKLSLSGDALTTFFPSGSTPYAGFFDNSIGVGSRAEGNGQPCGRIDPGQTLSMGLGSALTGKVIDYAEIDLEGKFEAVVKVDGYFVDASGAHLMKSETYPTTGANSGPDSADGDNYRVRFPITGTTAVNRLDVYVMGSVGSASLEGGTDGTAACSGTDTLSTGCGTFSLGQTIDDTFVGDPTFTTDSLFHLVEADGVLACGGTATLSEAGITSFVERLDNIGGGCGSAIPYDQASSTQTTVCNPDPDGQSEQCTFFRKDLLGQQAQFFWTVTWGAADETYMPHDTQFDFGDGRGYVDAQFCLADGPDSGTFPDLPPTADPNDNPSAVDPYCVVETHSVLQGDGRVVVTEKYFGQLDPGSRR